MTKYDTFADITKPELRLHNRVAVLNNIFEAGGMGMTSLPDAIEYINAIPEDERAEVISQLANNWGVQQ